ncbi:hypothetical protein ACJOMT_00910 [Mycoplasmopsis synoviae]|uniref:hypothetical protein n=1 Tax=Mycoplasmopsis synoviae TaxID=2109 RepID=UPI000CA262C3|nr:hypothetical protein [Mycoplasmopsis synoviae]AKJ20985.1 hypothetical protein MSHv_05230 [Mycoplasmopsis synoviae]AQU48320.1 hypothetical protein ADF19_05230 [Mycoplasmopsis synoviae]AWL83899.1 hypothetical protein MSH_00335 [Mycoplasmopsis synoviae]QLE13629.1 hypothetical protein DEH79_00330 [Mycoplasmopsis synoviae]UZF64383.1 hypothetical protein N0B76_00330 [Mycoplasmopsis synoviae]
MAISYKQATSKDLNLSFDFEITYFEMSKFVIDIKNTLRPLEFNEKYCEWFIEDLIYFLKSNDYNFRFDLGLLELVNGKNLKKLVNKKPVDLNDLEFEEIKYFLEKKITNFDVRITK